MAERIVSPGVFTRERDLSFLPQAIGEIGAAIIGPTKKGPAFTPTQVTNFQQFEDIFGGTDTKFYVPHTAEQYLRSAGVVTIVRVLGLNGYQADTVQLVVHSGSYQGNTPDGSGFTATTATQSLAILAPSRGSSGIGDLSSTTASGSFSSFNLQVSGSNVTAEPYVISFSTQSATFIDKVISPDAQSEKAGATDSSVYVYKVFGETAHLNFGLNPNTGTDNASVVAINNANGLDFTGGVNTINGKGQDDTLSAWTGNKSFQSARTPYLQSQLINGTRYELFRVYTRSHGTDMNSSYKIHILNVKDADDVAGSDYGTFALQVRVHNPNGIDDDDIVQTFESLTLDPTARNYFAKMIGDRYVESDSNGKLTYYGDYPNLSNHIRVGDYGRMEEDGVFKYPTNVVPMGHAAISNTVAGGTNIPAATFQELQVDRNGNFASTIFYGFKYISLDNRQYLGPIPNASAVGNNITMSLEDFFGHTDASALGSTFSDGTEKITLALSNIAQRKFTVPMQWGFDGVNPATPVHTGPNISSDGTNTQGFDLSTSTSNGTVEYKRAINTVSNPDEFDINLLAIPGVIHGLHSAVTNHAISKVESRADALYIMDATAYGDSIDTMKTAIKTLDTNYAATYYPWVRIIDPSTDRGIWVPPSVVLPGVIAYTDQIAHEWFAPAGLNRGGLTSVTDAKTRLTHAERDDLYENRINPIASFPGQGVVVFGQKTLQSKPSALDRINVRRLLIALRKFIASTSRYLVFEQNSAATRNRFLNVVNPYLNQVQQNSGLSAFRVVMDDSNNTPDVVDRNQLVGQIFIQPTRTAEFIVLDFVVQPTGATFPE
jgi:hypothetical protein